MAQSVYDRFLATVRQRLTNSGTSSASVSRSLGLSERYVSNVLTKHSRPSRANAVRLMTTLGFNGRDFRFFQQNLLPRLNPAISSTTNTNTAVTSRR